MLFAEPELDVVEVVGNGGEVVVDHRCEGRVVAGHLQWKQVRNKNNDATTN